MSIIGKREVPLQPVVAACRRIVTMIDDAREFTVVAPRTLDQANWVVSQPVICSTCDQTGIYVPNTKYRVVVISFVLEAISQRQIR